MLIVLVLLYETDLVDAGAIVTSQLRSRGK